MSARAWPRGPLLTLPGALCVLCTIGCPADSGGSPSLTQREPLAATPEQLGRAEPPARGTPTPLPNTGDFDASDAAQDWNPTGIAWRDLDTGLEEAARTGKPALLVMHTTWCGHCRNYAQLFYDPRVVARAQDLVMISVDSDEDPRVNRRFVTDGHYVPRTYVLNSDGSHRAELHNGRDRFRYFLDERDSGQLLTMMNRALQ